MVVTVIIAERLRPCSDLLGTQPNPSVVVLFAVFSTGSILPPMSPAHIARVAAIAIQVAELQPPQRLSAVAVAALVCVPFKSIRSRRLDTDYGHLADCDDPTHTTG